MILPLALCAASLLQPAPSAPPKLVPTPAGAAAASAALFHGTLYVVYGKGSDAFCIRSQDDGDTFSLPVAVNHRPHTVTVGGERGPKILVTEDGTLHVIWIGDYRKGGGVWYTRSRDAGRTFEPERNLEDRPFGCDGAAITGKGRDLYAFWLDGRGKNDAENPVTGTLVMAVSHDGGATWSPSEEVRYDFAGRPCACCRLEARTGPGDVVTVVFRSGYRNIRDFYLLRSRASELPIMRAQRASSDEWKLEGCPMMGASFITMEDGSSFMAWMARGRVYWRRMLPQAGPSNPVEAPQSSSQRYPWLAPLPQAARALLWREEGRICWEIFTSSGRTPVQRGSLPASKPDAFCAVAGSRGRLLVLE